MHPLHRLRPQGRRAQGHRSTGGAGSPRHRGNHPRRRPAVRHPPGHRERAGDRGARGSGGARGPRAGGVRGPRGGPARRARAPTARRRARRRDQCRERPAGSARDERIDPRYGQRGAPDAPRSRRHRLLIRFRLLDRRGRAVARPDGDGRAAGPGRRGAAVLVRQGEHAGRHRGGHRCPAEDRREGPAVVRRLAPVSERVLVAMSGGVDSSVAAALLVEQGYDVVGATMKLFCYGDSVPDRPCCSLDSITDARLVAHKLGIPPYVLNFEDRFGRDVIANFVAEYASGRTPIPCVRCNSFTKFRDFLYHADASDCANVSTGSYVCAREGALFRVRDPRKDQSYFLWGIDRSVVARMLTPVGDLTKRETRAVARRLGLVTAEKVESVEICFVPDDDYVGVLERHLPADAPALTPGLLVTAGGAVVGEHAGFARYTIGQRRGLPGGFREPMYVVAIRPETREVVIGSGDELFGHSVTLAELNWLADALAPRHGPIAAIRGTFQSVPGAPARQRSALTPEESHASTSPLSATVRRGRHRAARCRLRRQPAPTEETGRPARDRRQRPGAGYELHLRAVPELLVRHDVCADCREPDGGPAAAAARRAAHARDPPRSLARREPARRHGAARCARAIERCHRGLDLPARGRVGHDVYVERDDLPGRGKRPGAGGRRAVER